MPDSDMSHRAEPNLPALLVTEDRCVPGDTIIAIAMRLHCDRPCLAVALAFGSFRDAEDPLPIETSSRIIRPSPGRVSRRRIPSFRGACRFETPPANARWRIIAAHYLAIRASGRVSRAHRVLRGRRQRLAGSGWRARTAYRAGSTQRPGLRALTDDDRSRASRRPRCAAFRDALRRGHRRGRPALCVDCPLLSESVACCVQEVVGHRRFPVYPTPSPSARVGRTLRYYGNGRRPLPPYRV